MTAECGTIAGYRRHIRYQEPTCGPCRRANCESSKASLHRMQQLSPQERDLLVALDAAKPGPWAEDAACARSDPDAFFPEIGGTTRPAKRVCERCPVRQECLQFAMETDQRDGIWGGLDRQQRIALKKQGQAA